MKTYKLKFNGETYKVFLKKETYMNTGGLAVILYTEDGDCFADLTKSLGNLMYESDTSAFIDTNNLGANITDWLEKHHIAEWDGINCKSGFCEYPLYKFDLTKLV